jgi:thioredoxin-dependent peroxiredoxin
MKSMSALAALAAIALTWSSASADATSSTMPSVGSTAPEAVLQSVIGGKVESFDLLASAKTGPIVLYFFPKAFTSGCTIEARVFGQKLADFSKLGYTVVGVSADDIPTLTKFATAESAGQRFVSDPTGKLINAFGIATEYHGQLYANRVTFVIGTDGKIEIAVVDDVPQSNIATTMAWAQQHPMTSK